MRENDEFVQKNGFAKLLKISHESKLEMANLKKVSLVFKIATGLPLQQITKMGKNIYKLLQYVKASINHALSAGILLLAALLILGQNGMAQKSDANFVEYADGFQLQRTEKGWIIDVESPFVNGDEEIIYKLENNTQVESSEVANGDTIHIATPVKKMVLLSTTHVAMMDWLNIEGRIAGISDYRYLVDESVRKRVQGGLVTKVGHAEQIDLEQIIALEPGLVMAVGRNASQARSFNVLAKAGIPVLYNTEWRETTPLGRAEWVKVFAALTGKWNLGDSLFTGVENAYEKAAQKVAQIDKRPVVMLNTAYKGNWFVPGGDSYMAEFIEKAGGYYPWRSVEQSHSLNLDFEAAYKKLLEADIWLHPGTAKTLRAVANKDIRYTKAGVFKEGKIYNNTRQVGEQADGNPFWERGVAEPHLILRDLIHIFHPHLLPDYQPVYYEQLSASEEK